MSSEESKPDQPQDEGAEKKGSLLDPMKVVGLNSQPCNIAILYIG